GQTAAFRGRKLCVLVNRGHGIRVSVRRVEKGREGNAWHGGQLLRLGGASRVCSSTHQRQGTLRTAESATVLLFQFDHSVPSRYGFGVALESTQDIGSSAIALQQGRPGFVVAWLALPKGLDPGDAAAAELERCLEPAGGPQKTGPTATCLGAVECQVGIL